MIDCGQVGDGGNVFQDKLENLQVIAFTDEGEYGYATFINPFPLCNHTQEITRRNIGYELVDWFGNGFHFSEKEAHYEVRLTCNEEAMKYWALQYGEYVEIVEPLSLRNSLSYVVNTMKQKYE